MANSQIYYQQDYSGGLNNTASPIEIAPNEASLLRNWDITYQGQLVRRDGLVLLGNAGLSPITGGEAFIRNTGIDLLITESTNLRYLNGPSLSILKNNLTPQSIWFENIQVLGKIFFGSEDNALAYWDRASTTLNTCITTVANALPSMAGVPHGNVYHWYKNHLFTLNNVNVGGTKYPNRIYWTNIGDPTAWDTTNNFFEIPGDGRAITAVPMGDSLVIFKERAVQFLTGWGNTSWQVTESASDVSNLDERIGCPAPRGACAVGNEVWFIDNEANIRRIYQTDFQAMRRDIISTKIQATLRGINKSQIPQCVTWSNGQKVYFAFPNGTDTHNSIICVFDIIAAKRGQANAYSYVPEAWTTYTGWTPSLFFDYPTSTVPDLIVCDALTGNVYRKGGNDDNGVAIDARWDGKLDYYDNPLMWKRYQQGRIRGQSASGNANIYIWASVDGGSFANVGTLNLTGSGGTLGPTGHFELGPTGTTAILGGNTQKEVSYFFTNGGGTARGRSAMMSIRHNAAGQKPTVNTFSNLYKNHVVR